MLGHWNLDGGVTLLQTSRLHNNFVSRSNIFAPLFSREPTAFAEFRISFLHNGHENAAGASSELFLYLASGTKLSHEGFETRARASHPWNRDQVWLHWESLTWNETFSNGTLEQIVQKHVYSVHQIVSEWAFLEIDWPQYASLSLRRSTTKFTASANYSNIPWIINIPKSGIGICPAHVEMQQPFMTQRSLI